jgi:hypothetical protein
MYLEPPPLLFQRIEELLGRRTVMVRKVCRSTGRHLRQ